MGFVCLFAFVCVCLFRFVSLCFLWFCLLLAGLWPGPGALTARGHAGPSPISSSPCPPSAPASAWWAACSWSATPARSFRPWTTTAHRSLLRGRGGPRGAGSAHCRSPSIPCPGPQLSKMLEMFRSQQADLEKKKTELDAAIEAFKTKHGIKVVQNPEK